MGKSKPIKVDSTVKARVKAERTPPDHIIGMALAYRKQKEENKEAKRAQDSLQRVIIELKAQLGKK